MGTVTFDLSHQPRLHGIKQSVGCESSIFVTCFKQRQFWSGCSGSGDHVELLGGNGVDTSKMLPVADLCFSVGGFGEFEHLRFSFQKQTFIRDVKEKVQMFTFPLLKSQIE